MLELCNDRVSFHSYHFTLHTCVVHAMIVPATLLQHHLAYRMGLIFHVSNLSWIADFHYIHSFYFCGSAGSFILSYIERLYICANRTIRLSRIVLTVNVVFKEMSAQAQKVRALIIPCAAERCVLWTTYGLA